MCPGRSCLSPPTCSPTGCYLATLLFLEFLNFTGCRDELPPKRAYFVDVASSAGLEFTHTSGARGDYFLIETMGSGAAFFDYDNDGYVDIYLVDGFSLAGLGQGFEPLNLVKKDEQYYLIKHPKEYSYPLRFDGQVDSTVYLVHQPPTIPPTRNRLYRNNRDGSFSETTLEAGVGDTGYGMGCTVGDYDNDGDMDLYVTNYGPNVLYRNEGNGHFTDVTAEAGVGDPHWSTSAAFFDYNGDRYLDLYVVNYLDFNLKNNQICGGMASSWESPGGTLLKMAKNRRTYCSPQRYNGAPNVLYRNEGNGRFSDVTREMDVFSLYGKGLGIATADFDADGDTDVYIANDSVRNFLYRNDRGYYFQDVALNAGVAFDNSGQAKAGMGTDWGDCDNDGDLDLFVTNFALETNSLYRNEANGSFMDITEQAGLAQSSLNPLGFGTFFFDADNDGDLDLFVANGHVQDRVHLFKGTEHLTYAQPNQFFENISAGRFTDASESSGPALESVLVSRGAARADYDNDGDLDILVTNSNGPVQLYRNDLPPGTNWLSVRLLGKHDNRDAVGAKIKLTCGVRTQVREVKTSGSYLSANDIRQHFGLGNCTKVENLEIRWPSGAQQQFRDIHANQFLVIEQE